MHSMQEEGQEGRKGVDRDEMERGIKTDLKFK